MAVASSPIQPDLTSDHSGSFLQQGFGGEKTRRAWGLGLAILIELLIIALLFLVGSRMAGSGREAAPVTSLEAVTFDLPDQAEEEPAEQPPEAATTEVQPAVEPQPESAPTEPDRAPPPITANPTPAPVPPPAVPAPPAPQAKPAPPQRTYGPVDTGPQIEPDSQRVGTAPNGEPLYAARWYREPTRQELSGYLSTATAPSAALIACRTVPDFRVEDCELVAESPAGSMIGRAVLAAAWQFRVRPARVGGKSQVGSWVRIRIDYTFSQ